MTDLQISKRGAMELLAHEGAVLEAYKDSVGVWTWGIGITNNSGHQVFPRYRRNPQTLTRVLQVYLWALKRYEKDVIDEFKPYKLNEHQLAAAVSFHYNTGAIRRASWVKHFKEGKISDAKRAFMNWSKPKEITPRRQAERDLFFDGKWKNPTKITIWGVHSNGNVNWGDRRSVDATKALGDAYDWDGKEFEPAIEKEAQPRQVPPSILTALAALVAAIAGYFGADLPDLFSKLIGG